MTVPRHRPQKVVSRFLTVTLDDGQKFVIKYDEGTLDRLFWQLQKQGLKVEWGKTEFSWTPAE